MAQPIHPPRRKGPLAWMLIGIGTIVGVVVLFLGVSIFIGRTNYNDEVAKSGEAVAKIKLLLKLNSDLVLESEEADGSFIVRSKSTGKRQRLREDQRTKRVVTLDLPSDALSSGENAAGELPSGIPPYPGVAIEKTADSPGPDGVAKIFTFATKDSARQVLEFYERHLKDSGFKIADMKIQPSNGILMAQDSDGSRRVELTMSRSGEVVIKIVTPGSKPGQNKDKQPNKVKQ